MRRGTDGQSRHGDAAHGGVSSGGVARNRDPPEALGQRNEMGVRSMSRSAVFLDRDGVLVEEVLYPETGEIEAPLKAEDVRLIPGAAASARRLAAAGYALVLVSNQGGMAKGKT